MLVRWMIGAAFLLWTSVASAKCDLWVATYHSGAGLGDVLNDLDVDDNGNTFAVGQGSILDFGDPTNWVICKVSPGGEIMWTRTINRGGTSVDLATAVAVDQAGSPVVIGTSGSVLIMEKYTPEGGVVWSTSIAGGMDAVVDIAVDHTDNAITVVGRKASAGTANDWVIRHFNSLGTEQWTQTYSSSTSYENDCPKSVTVGPTGEIAVTGSVRDCVDWMVRVYDRSGSLLWSDDFGIANGQDEEARAAAYGSNGRLVVVGVRMTRAYGSGGSVLWTRQGDPTGWARGESVAIYDDNKYSAVAASLYGFDATGSQLWTEDFHDLGGGTFSPHTVSADPSGNLVVGGNWSAYGAGAESSWRVVKMLNPGQCPGMLLGSFVGDVGIYPNPVNGDSVKLAFELGGDAAEVRADVYNTALKPVWSATWRDVRQYEGGITMAGLRRWAPGAYIVHVEVKLASGKSKTYMPARLVVKR